MSADLYLGDLKDRKRYVNRGVDNAKIYFKGKGVMGCELD